MYHGHWIASPVSPQIVDLLVHCRLLHGIVERLEIVDRGMEVWLRKLDGTQQTKRHEFVIILSDFSSHTTQPHDRRMTPCRMPQPRHSYAGNA